MQSLWKTVWRFLKKLKIELSYSPAIKLPSIYKNIYIKILIQKLIFSAFPSDFISLFYKNSSIISQFNKKFKIQDRKDRNNPVTYYKHDSPLFLLSRSWSQAEHPSFQCWPGVGGASTPPTPPLMRLKWLYISVEPRLCCPAVLANRTLQAEGPNHSIPLQI